MAKKRKDTMEFRFYEIPQGESALVLYGEPWVRTYGHEDIRLHFHNLMEIGICRYGEGTMMLDERNLRYSDGSLNIIPEKFPHNTVSDGAENNFWEYIFCDPKSLLEDMYPDNVVYRNNVLKAINGKPIMCDSAERPELVGLIDSVIREASQRRPLYRQQIDYYMKAIMTELIRTLDDPEMSSEIGIRGGNMQQISRALEYISKSYDREISVAQLAEVAGLSETHFRRVFTAYINMTPTDYVSLCRIQNACELMKRSDDPMDLVAAKCGFATTSTFNRNFKKFLGTSPYKWKIAPENYEHKLLNFKISALKGW